jgi:hypothetical protein
MADNKKPSLLDSFWRLRLQPSPRQRPTIRVRVCKAEEKSALNQAQSMEYRLRKHGGRSPANIVGDQEDRITASLSGAS